MFCPNCNKENQNDSEYCFNCGINLAHLKVSQTPQRASVPPPPQSQNNPAPQTPLGYFSPIPPVTPVYSVPPSPPSTVYAPPTPPAATEYSAPMPQPNRAYVSSSPPVYSAPRKSAGTIILSVFLVLTIIGAGVLGFLYLDSNNKIDDLNQQVTENNSSIGTLNQTIVSKDATITSLNQTNSSLSSQNNTLTSQNTSLTTQLGTFQSKYPAKPFYSGNAAVTWFNNNAIFYRGNDLQYATDVQQKAADAGFIVNITFGDTLTFVTAICSNGDLVGAFNGGYIYLN